MIIANPIYDVVFKRLMEDDRIAKFFIGTLLDETIEDVQVKPQEFTYTDQLAGLSVFRVDFIATIKTADNEFKKVLIEIQKAKNPIDLMRFRKYLGEQYKKEDEVETGSGKQRLALPIVTIYLLGFSLPEIESAAVKVNRQYTDLLTREIIHKKGDFIEKLTHSLSRTCFGNSYVVQMQRIQGKMQNRLEKLLSVFEQKYFADDNGIIKEYNYPIDDEAIKAMIDLLHHAGTDPQQKKKIEDEQEAYRIMDLAVKEKADELRAEIAKNKKELEEKDKAISEKDKAISEKDKALAEMAAQLKELKRRLSGQ